MAPVNAVAMISFSSSGVALFRWILATHTAWNLVDVFVLSYPYFFDVPPPAASNDSMAARFFVKYATAWSKLFWMIGRSFH